MNTIQGILVTGLPVLVAACTSITEVVQSPLGGIAVGAAGPRDAMIYVEPYCCPSTALEVRAKEVVSENQTQWVNLGFSVAREGSNKSVTGVEVCYEIKSETPGQTYISQTRLTDMTIPNAAFVKLDDPTDRTDTAPQCYTVQAGYVPEGAVTLGLRVVFGDVDDSIVIGSTRLLF